jgi:hypothetical protein
MKKDYLIIMLSCICLALGLPNAYGQTEVFDYTGEMVSWTVPIGVTSINIEALGAQGASGNPSFVGGRGARMSGDFDVVPGSTIIIAVGGQGQGQSSNSHGGGGGGSFVVIEDATSPNIISVGPFAGTPVTPLVIAGGGAGTRAACAQNGNPGLIGINGGAGIVATTGGGGPSGVTPGMGGTIFSSWGSAGAGFIGNGANDGTLVAVVNRF